MKFRNMSRFSYCIKYQKYCRVNLNDQVATAYSHLAMRSTLLLFISAKAINSDSTSVLK